jgi:predicted oxidoreductase
MNLIDNADVYGLDWGGTHFGACEEALGRVLATVPGLRDRIVLASKGGINPGVPYDSSAQYLTKACEASLTRMGVDHIDLYQIHRPDMFTHPEEIAATFDSLRTRGLVREFGVSNYTVSQTLALNGFLESGLVSTQPEFSAIHLDPMRDGTFDLCEEAGIVPLAWSALAGGRLATGNAVRPELIAILDDLAVREGVTRSAIAIAFVLAHPSQPIAIVGTQNAERIAEIAKATSVSLTRTDVYSIVQASDGVSLP